MGVPPIYDSAYIQNYITEKYASHAPTLLPSTLDEKLYARQIQVLAEGVMDAIALNFFEQARGKEKMSQEWFNRQNRKIGGGMKALAEMVKEVESKGEEYLVANTNTIADIAAASAVGFVDFVIQRGDFGEVKEWRGMYPEWRESFKETKPVMFDIKDKIV